MLSIYNLNQVNIFCNTKQMPFSPKKNVCRKRTTAESDHISRPNEKNAPGIRVEAPEWIPPAGLTTDTFVVTSNTTPPEAHLSPFSAVPQVMRSSPFLASFGTNRWSFSAPTTTSIGASQPFSLFDPNDTFTALPPPAHQKTFSPPLQPRKFVPGETIWVLDPHTRKLKVPADLIVPTAATAMQGTTPSLCLAFMEGTCRHPWCRQAHVSREVVERLREEAQNAPNCCRKHECVGSTTFLTDRFQVVEVVFSNGKRTSVASDQLACTVGLQRHLAQNVSKEKSGKLELNSRMVCRLHMNNRCRYLDDCNNIHICREHEELQVLLKSNSGANDSAKGSSVSQSPVLAQTQRANATPTFSLPPAISEQSPAIPPPSYEQTAVSIAFQQSISQPCTPSIGAVGNAGTWSNCNNCAMTPTHLMYSKATPFVESSNDSTYPHYGDATSTGCTMTLGVLPPPVVFDANDNITSFGDDNLTPKVLIPERHLYDCTPVTNPYRFTPPLPLLPDYEGLMTIPDAASILEEGNCKQGRKNRKVTPLTSPRKLSFSSNEPMVPMAPLPIDLIPNSTGTAFDFHTPTSNIDAAFFARHAQSEDQQCELDTLTSSLYDSFLKEQQQRHCSANQDQSRNDQLIRHSHNSNAFFADEDDDGLDGGVAAELRQQLDVLALVFPK